MSTSDNVVWHSTAVSQAEREQLNGHRGAVLWYTGLSGSGKSTVANVVDHKLHADGRHGFLLDGDNLRHGINGDLDFTPAGRKENIRRVVEVAKLLADAGLIVSVAVISPYRADRERARERIGKERFFEVFMDTPLEICEQRDPKGLYAKARAGEIKGFTGIDDPYEAPEDADVHLRGGGPSPEELADQVLAALRARGITS
jgi:adenylylsulfate kinase